MTEGGEGSATGAEFEKLCTNDKVVQSITALQANNRTEEERRRQESKGVTGRYKAFSAECEQLKRQIDELEA